MKKKLMSKKEFIILFENSMLDDIEDREDCKNAWNGLIDTLKEEGALTDSAYRWVNPYLNNF